MEFNDRRANKRALKAANSNTVFKVNKPMTRLVAGTAKVGHNVQVTPGSKKETRLQKRNEWAENYGKQQMQKFDARMKKGK